MADSSAPARQHKSSGDRKPREERWAEILEVAAEVFAEKGYDATSLQEIATRTGILKGSIYYYINTKGDMLAHLLRQAHDKGLSNIQPLAEGPGNAAERLAAMIRRHAEYVCTDRNLTAVFVHERRRLTPEQSKAYLGDEHAYRRLFQRVISEGQKEGTINPDLDPKLTALYLLGSVNSLYQWFQPNSQFSVSKVCEHLVKSTLGGLAAVKA